MSLQGSEAAAPPIEDNPTCEFIHRELKVGSRDCGLVFCLGHRGPQAEATAATVAEAVRAVRGSARRWLSRRSLVGAPSGEAQGDR
jgi:hypothetical protein